MRHPKLAAALVAGGLAVLAAHSAIAQGNYPDHPIRMVLPFSAGVKGE